MRIPPAVAREIGQHFAVARVNESAARTLDDSSKLIDRAARNAELNRTSAALAAATQAVELIGTIAVDADGLDRRANEATAASLTYLSTAIDALGASDAASAAAALADGSKAALLGARVAASAGFYARSVAEELSRQYM